MPNDERGPTREADARRRDDPSAEEPDHAGGAPRREAGRPATGRRFFLADPRAQSTPGRAQLTEIAAILAESTRAQQWYERLDLGPLEAIASPHEALAARLLTEIPPDGDADALARDQVHAALRRHGLGWLLDDEQARARHAEQAWDALYAAHAGVADAVPRVTSLTQVLRVCRLAELVRSAPAPGWRDLADAAAAWPMVPAEIYRAQRTRRRQRPGQVARAVAVPVAAAGLDGSALGPQVTPLPAGQE